MAEAAPERSWFQKGIPISGSDFMIPITKTRISSLNHRESATVTRMCIALSLFQISCHGYTEHIPLENIQSFEKTSSCFFLRLLHGKNNRLFTLLKGTLTPGAPGPQAGPTQLASGVPACRFKTKELFSIKFWYQLPGYFLVTFF